MQTTSLVNLSKETFRENKLREKFRELNNGLLITISDRVVEKKKSLGCESLNKSNNRNQLSSEQSHFHNKHFLDINELKSLKLVCIKSLSAI